MEKTMVATGKTIDLAIEAALNQLGMDRDSVSVQVLAQAKSGFLGIGAQPAKVQITYEVPDEAPKAALSSASRSKPKKKPEAPKQEVKPEPPKAAAPKQEAKPAAPKAEKKPEPKKEAPKAPKEPKEPKVYTPAEPGSVEEKIETFLKGLLEHMDSKAVPHAVKGEDNTYHVDLVGEDLGF